MRIVILGYIVRGPYGGLVWHHLQYVLGLKKLGHEVLFLEDSDFYASCSSPSNPVLTTDASYGLRFIHKIFSDFNIKDSWSYFDQHTNTWFGLRKQKVFSFCKTADLVINISAINPPRDWWLQISNRFLIDTDPVFTQIRHLTIEHGRQSAQLHTAFFSFGENIGKPGCNIPDDGFAWKPTRQPVFLETWKYHFYKDAHRWTTVMQWDSYKEQLYQGQVFGMKSLSFDAFWNLPSRLPEETFELALGNCKAGSLGLEKNGWNTINSLVPTKSPWTYQRYIQQSKGEWSVAKHGYVISNSGWFSERSACYLASGKPVVVQETGFSENITTGEGLLSYRTAEECAGTIERVSCDYLSHCVAARKIAEEQFDSQVVLGALLRNIT